MIRLAAGLLYRQVEAALVLSPSAEMNSGLSRGPSVSSIQFEMDTFGQPDASNPASFPAALPRGGGVGAGPPTLRLRTIRLYQMCDAFTGPLIYFMVIFGPWAFGTTQRWSVWTMTVAGFALGMLLGIKLFIRLYGGYRVPRWGDHPSGAHATGQYGIIYWGSVWTRLLALLTVAILGYCLIAALNARSTCRPDLVGFEYHRYVPWLPHSYAARHSWFAFWNYLGLALAFWSLRDWLLGQTAGESRAARGKDPAAASLPKSPLPARLRRLLWLVAVNAAVLSLVGIIQRASGTDKVLWLVKPRIPAGAFGPYNYQSNAAQYFNLVWPVSLAFWWTLRRGVRRGLRPGGPFGGWGYQLLLPCAMITALGPLISNSRAGAIIGTANLMIAISILLLSRRRREGLAKLGTFLLFVTTLLLGVGFGWSQLGPRMEQIRQDFDSRESMYRTGRIMAQDCPVFGTGPGTFDPLFQLYRSSPDEYWPAQLHNDWLETRITFGWLGSGLIGLALAAILIRWFAPGGIQAGWRFSALLWLALVGCLAHARFDFPFQVHSILFLFLLFCAILSVSSRRS